MASIFLWNIFLNIYSNLPNKPAANLINFWKYSQLHNIIKTYSFVNFWDLSFLDVIFTFINEDESLITY